MAENIKDKMNSKVKIRYAVVGLGHIAQIAVLPAFKHAGRNSELVAFVSDNPDKIKEMSKEYGVKHSFSYDKYDQCLKSGEVDAVYIALPNSMHKDFTIKAANAGVHVLTEKVMATDEAECVAMIRAAEENDIKLMIAYRLHFDEANMQAVDIVNSGTIGEPRFFHSTFSMQVREGNIRTDKDLAGGPLNDIGVYCINAARYLFRAEPTDVMAMNASSSDRRFSEVDEMVSALMRFPGERLATFTCSFGAGDVSMYEVVGSAGRIKLDPAYDYALPLKYELVSNGRTSHKEFPKRDQFAPELLYFSDCILNDIEPEPSGYEGMADMRVIDAIKKSAATGKVVSIEPVRKTKRPEASQVEQQPAVAKPHLIQVESGSQS